MFNLDGRSYSACGKKHSDDDLIVAIDIAIYGYDTSVASSVCGKYVEIVNPANGHSVTAMIAGAYSSINHTS